MEQSDPMSAPIEIRLLSPYSFCQTVENGLDRALTRRRPICYTKPNRASLDHVITTLKIGTSLFSAVMAG